MRILHLITRLIVGGAQENTILSCQGQVRAGHQVCLAHGPIYGPEGSLADQARLTGARIVVVPALRRPVHPPADLLAYRQCLSLIHQFKPHIVHTHSAKAGILGRLAASHARVPVIVHTIHGLPFHPYQSPLKNALYAAAERFAARRCHKLVSVADAMTRQALARRIGSPDQFITIYSGMDTRPFLQAPPLRHDQRARLGFGPQDLVIGTIARLSPLKGHDDLLDALPAVLARHPHVKLLWVGDGWWRNRLQQRIENAGWADRFHLTGLVDPERIPALCSAMDLLVHPSYREGLPRALPQALLCRTPVVAYDTDGAAEVCIDGQTGRLVPPGNIPALAQAINWMLEHPDQRVRMAHRGCQLCAERFSAEKMNQQLLDLYNQLWLERLGSRESPP